MRAKVISSAMLERGTRIERAVGDCIRAEEEQERRKGKMNLLLFMFNGIASTLPLSSFPRPVHNVKTNHIVNIILYVHYYMYKHKVN